MCCTLVVAQHFCEEESCSEDFLCLTACICDAERPILAPYTAGAHKGGQTSAPHHEGAASSGPSAVQLQLAERIADAVAARLQHHAVQSSAQQPHRDLSSVQVCCDTTLPHAAPQAASVKGKAAGALSQQMRGDAPEDPSVHLKERVVHRQACEEDFLAALLQGSPGKPSHAGQPDRPQACEQDFLAALLLTPGTSGRTSHAASPGLMHKDSCSNADGRAAAVEKLADSRVQPWTSQWAGKLTQQQMETAVQEVPAQLSCLPIGLSSSRDVRNFCPSARMHSRVSALKNLGRQGPSPKPHRRNMHAGRPVLMVPGELSSGHCQFAGHS